MGNTDATPVESVQASRSDGHASKDACQQRMAPREGAERGGARPDLRVRRARLSKTLPVVSVGLRREPSQRGLLPRRPRSRGRGRVRAHSALAERSARSRSPECLGGYFPRTCHAEASSANSRRAHCGQKNHAVNNMSGNYTQVHNSGRTGGSFRASRSPHKTREQASPVAECPARHSCARNESSTGQVLSRPPALETGQARTPVDCPDRPSGGRGVGGFA